VIFSVTFGVRGNRLPFADPMVYDVPPPGTGVEITTVGKDVYSVCIASKPPVNEKLSDSFNLASRSNP